MSAASVRRRAGRLQLPPVAGTPGQDGIISYRWIWYFLSFFVPFAGILTALFLYDQESWEVRKVGRNCLLIGFLVWVVFPLAVFMGLLLLGMMAVAGAVSGAISPTD